MGEEYEIEYLVFVGIQEAISRQPCSSKRIFYQEWEPQAQR